MRTARGAHGVRARLMLCCEAGATLVIRRLAVVRASGRIRWSVEAEDRVRIVDVCRGVLRRERYPYDDVGSGPGVMWGSAHDFETPMPRFLGTLHNQQFPSPIAQAGITAT